MNFVGQVAQPVGVLADEGVLLVAPQREVRVHARTLHADERFGHEARKDPRLTGELLNNVAYRHHRVGHGEGVGVAQVDLVLARRVFVLGVFDADAHLFEDEHSASAQLARRVVGREVEVAAAVDGHRSEGRVRVR